MGRVKAIQKELLEGRPAVDLRKVALECRLRAAEYERKAQTASFHSDRRYYSEMAQQWFVIAEGYETHFAQKQSRSNGQEVLAKVKEPAFGLC